MYVEGNVVNWIDPSGQKKCWPEDNPQVCQEVPPFGKPYIFSSIASAGYYYTVDFIEFEPSNDFKPAFFKSGVIAKDQFHKESGAGWGTGNLCGVFAVGVILQNLGLELGIDEIVNKYFAEVEEAEINADQGSSFWDLHTLVEAIPGFTTEPPWSLENQKGYFTYDKPELTFDQYYSDKVRPALRKEKIPIIRVGYQETATGYELAPHSGFGHFIAITGLSTTSYWQRGADWKWVRVYNSFRNGTEYYLAETLSTYQAKYYETMFVCREGSEEGTCAVP
jgi:hypothetical protein